MPSANGDLRVPMLRIFDIGDPRASSGNERRYFDLVAAMGRSDMLVQRAIRDYRHCRFASSELTDGFDALVEWVETGVSPAGDDVLAAADPNFGCQFTSPTGHGGGLFPIPACPAP